MASSTTPPAGAPSSAQGRHREALQAFEKATRLMPKYRSSWQNLADTHRALGQATQASRAASRAQSLPSTPVSAVQRQ
ncbi:MAG: tetratricopeptide repeat protein [Chthoniobacterales bacterium]|nr:tetratricopeptide repeat protein [Chthoniobacterales bacterium]